MTRIDGQKGRVVDIIKRGEPAMMLAELSRYWAAKELTQIERAGNTISFNAPFACPIFTVQLNATGGTKQVAVDGGKRWLRKVESSTKLIEDTWCLDGGNVTACFDLPKGRSAISIS